MANYYHEARAQVKKIKTLQEENKKRAERRAEIIAPVAPDPLQQLVAMGTSCKLLRGAESHAVNESGENLVPWNGQMDNMIDRFDVRALLDFYKEPDPRVMAARQKGLEELKLEETLRFESYRDLVRLMARGLTEQQGLKVVEQESLDRRAAQHAALQAATDAVYFNPKPGAAAGGSNAPVGLAGSGLSAGTGMYSAMGFAYDAGSTGAAAGPAAGGVAGAGAATDSSDSDDDDDDDDSEVGSEDERAGAAGPESEADLAQEVEDDRVDDMAEQFGLQDFSYRLHKALGREGEEEARLRKRPRKRLSRKKAANRAKRMAGMGLNPATGLPVHQHDPYGDPKALINPWDDGRDRDRHRASPDRLHQRRNSPSYDAGGWRTRPGDKEYITEFVSDAAPAASVDYHGNRHHNSGGGIIEALPDLPDPAMLGGIQPVKKEGTKQKQKPRQRQAQRQPPQEQQQEQEQEQRQGQGQTQQQEQQQKQKPNQAAPAAAKETPQERLKRLMQAQLNKAAQKDSLANAHKKIQAEKDKVARQQIERVVLAAGGSREADRGRDRSVSPVSRDRSRSPGGPRRAHRRSSSR
eukprot:gene11676-11819_t